MNGAISNEFASRDTAPERQGKRLDQTKAYLISGMVEDLEAASALFCQVREQWSEIDDVDTETLARLEKIFSIPGSNREWMHEFISARRQADIEACYRQAGNRIKEMITLKSQMQAIEKSFKTLLLALMNEEPQLSINDALDRMKGLNENEAARYKALYGQLGDAVMALCDVELRVSELQEELADGRRDAA